MVGFLGKGNVSRHWRQHATDLFERARLACMILIEPAVPWNWLGLEDTHTLCHRDHVDISGSDACIDHHLLDGLTWHATRHLHTTQTFFCDRGKDLSILQNGSRRGFTVNDA